MRWLVFLGALWLTACGGRVENDPNDDAPLPATPLGECVPGHSHYQAPELPCPWMADGLCYPDKLAACACACPRDRDSWCTSDFPKDDGAPTQVWCD